MVIYLLLRLISLKIWFFRYRIWVYPIGCFFLCFYFMKLELENSVIHFNNHGAKSNRFVGTR